MKRKKHFKLKKKEKLHRRRHERSHKEKKHKELSIGLPELKFTHPATHPSAKPFQEPPELPVKSPVHQEPIHKVQYVPQIPYKSPLMHKIYFLLSKFATKTQRRGLKNKLQFAGINEEVEIWIGQIILLGLLVAIATFLAFWIVFLEPELLNMFIYSATSFVAIFLAAIIHLNAQIDDRRKRLEDVLPDAMQVIAANIRAGMTPVVALRASARPELGPLQEDIKFATTKSLGTDSFTDALSEMARKTSSELFQRIVALFSASLKSGGHLSQLLENTAADVRETQELKKELIANTKLYAMFILFTVVIGTPLLLAVSIQFSSMIGNLQETTSTGGGVASEISSIPLISLPLSVEFLQNSALAILVITAILASALIGVINTGAYSSGLRYAPVIAIAAVLFFFLVKDYALKAILPVS